MKYVIQNLTLKEPIRSICNDYWDNINFHFENSVDDLAIKYVMSKYDISQIVKDNSLFILKCKTCDKKLSEFKLRSHLFTYLNKINNTLLCEDCNEYKEKENQKALYISKENLLLKKQELNLKNAEFRKKTIVEDLKISAGLKDYHKLDQDELETLIEISEGKTKEDILKKVFKGSMKNSHYSKKRWEIINLLDRMKLVWVERGENSKIVKFHIHNDLVENLKEDFPELYISISNEEHIKFNPFYFTIDKHLKKGKLQPDFTGVLRVKKPVFLKPYEEYSCGGWKNDDDTITIKIDSYSEI